MTQPKIAAVINARLKSSRLPRKMLLPFAGRTLIDIALEKLSGMHFFAGRYFGVAEDELAERLPAASGVTLLRRDPAAVEPGYNGNKKVFEHYQAIDAEYIFWLNACTPLLKAETIKKAYDLVISTRYNSYTSVVDCRDWIFDENGLPVTNLKQDMISTAHSRKFFRVAHAFHVVRKSFFMNGFIPWTLTQHDPELVHIPEAESYDINDELEFQVAEGAYIRAVRGGG